MSSNNIDRCSWLPCIISHYRIVSMSKQLIKYDINYHELYPQYISQLSIKDLISLHNITLIRRMKALSLPIPTVNDVIKEMSWSSHHLTELLIPLIISLIDMEEYDSIDVNPLFSGISGLPEDALPLIIELYRRRLIKLDDYLDDENIKIIFENRQVNLKSSIKS